MSRRRFAAEEERLTCEHGDIVEYLRLRNKSGRAAKSARKAAKRAYRQRIAETFADARTGTLYAFARGGELEYGVVLSVDPSRLRVINWYGESRGCGRIPCPLNFVNWGRSRCSQAGLFAIGRCAGRSLTTFWTPWKSEQSWGSTTICSILGPRFAQPRDQEFAYHPCANCPDPEQHIHDAETPALA